MSRRLLVALPLFGVTSEIWSIRQAAGMRRHDPVVMAWSRFDTAPADDAGLDVRTLDLPWANRGGPLRRLARRLGRADAGGDLIERERIRSLVAEVAPDAILCHFAWTGVRVAAALARTGGPPIIWHAHGRDASRSLQEPAFAAAVARHLPQAAGVVVVGRHQAGRLRPFGLDGVPHEVIPCGAPLATFGASEPTPRSSRTIRFITVGRVSAEKGAIQTIEAFARVHAAWPESELLVVGDGPERHAAETAAHVLGCDGAVTFAGMLDSEGVASASGSAHAFVQHSREVDGWVEGFGVSLTEAMARGLCPIVSASGGLLDQVDPDENGLVFPVDDVAAQADAMLRVARDESLRRRLATAAVASARRFDTARCIERLESFIEDCTVHAAA